jgi:hypothetical protein
MLLNPTTTSLSPPSSPSAAPSPNGHSAAVLGGHEHVPLTSIPTLASALLADDAGSMHHVHNFLASLAVKSSMAASLLSPFDQVPTWAATPQRRRRRRTNTADGGEAGNHKKTTSQKSTKRKVADDGGDDEAHPDTFVRNGTTTQTPPSSARRDPHDQGTATTKCHDHGGYHDRGEQARVAGDLDRVSPQRREHGLRPGRQHIPIRLRGVAVAVAGLLAHAVSNRARSALTTARLPAHPSRTARGSSWRLPLPVPLRPRLIGRGRGGVKRPQICTFIYQNLKPNPIIGQPFHSLFLFRVSFSFLLFVCLVPQ